MHDLSVLSNLDLLELSYTRNRQILDSCFVQSGSGLDRIISFGPLYIKLTFFEW